MSVIALDIGTSRIKALLANWDGAILAVRSVPTPVLADPGVRHEFPADAVRTTAETLIAGAAAAAPGDLVDTLVISCLGTAMVPVDRRGRALGAALSPADPRPWQEPGLRARIDLSDAAVFDLTGQDIRVSSSFLHWLWWRASRPAAMRRLHRFRSLRGFLVEGICGADAEDPSWASRTALMDLATDTWSATVLAAADLPADVLPPIHPSTTSWPVGRGAADRLGLARGARLVLGAMDNCCAFLGAASPREQRLVNIAGTYEHLAGVGDLALVRAAAVVVDGLIHRFVLPATFLSYSRVPLGLLLSAVAEATPGGIEPLLRRVRPRPTGRAVPLDEASVRTALAGGEHPGDVLQAILETAGATLAQYADAWRGGGGQLDRIVVVGGGAAHPRSLRLKATILGRPISTLASDEASGIGALRLATIAAEGATLAGACSRFGNRVVRSWPRAAG